MRIFPIKAGDFSTLRTMHLSPLFILLFFAFAAHSQVQERVAILNTVDDSKPELDFTVLTYLTNSLREIAVKMLPENKYFVMTSQSIIEMLGPERKEECKNKCMLDMGKAISADYIGQARLGRLGGNLTITMELYHIRGNLIGSFNGNAKDEFGLVAVINEKAPAMFRKMLGVSSGPIIESGTYSVQTSGGDYEFAGEKRYLVNISSDPEGAGLSFNGLPLSNCKETPCKAELREGSVRIIANLEQYEIADTTVSIKQNNQSIRIRMKANFGVLEIKPVYSDGIGRDEQWGLSINGKTFSSFENRLSPNKYSVELSHRCYEDISFEAGINKDRREVFDMASHIKLKKGGLVLSAEADGEPVSEPVFVNGKQVGETPFSSSVPVCAKIEIGEGRENVNVEIKPNKSVKYTHKMNTEERRRRLEAEQQARQEAEQQELERQERERERQEHLAKFKEPQIPFGIGGAKNNKVLVGFINPEFVSVADGHLSFGVNADLGFRDRDTTMVSFFRGGTSAKLSFFDYRWLYLTAGASWYKDYEESYSGPSFSVGGGIRLGFFVDMQYYIIPMNNRNASYLGIKVGFSLPYSAYKQ